MSFTPIVLTATYHTPEGTAASGSVTFTASQDMYQHDLSVPAVPEKVTLNGSGHFSVTLYATNDPATLPAGVTYLVTEAIFGAPIDQYHIVLPYDAVAGTVDLSALGRS